MDEEPILHLAVRPVSPSWVLTHASQALTAQALLGSAVPPAQRTRFQQRRPSEREVGVCCKPELGSLDVFGYCSSR